VRLASWRPGADGGTVGAGTVAAHGRAALALPARGSIVVIACRRAMPTATSGYGLTHIANPFILRTLNPRF
jgi:hypothetical protein